MMESSKPWTLSGMEKKSAQLNAPMQNFLQAVIRDQENHAQFLHMLSLMEHIGSRKIMLSQMRGILSQEILKHLAEETRHAFFFKRQAEKYAGRELEGYDDQNTMCFGPAQIYFGRLDSRVRSYCTQNGQDNIGKEALYLWMSLIVELRACWFYHLYQETLQDSEEAMSLKSIIAEEDLHLQAMYDRLEEIGVMQEQVLFDLCSIECTLFDRLWDQLQGSAGVQPLAA